MFKKMCSILLVITMVLSMYTITSANLGYYAGTGDSLYPDPNCESSEGLGTGATIDNTNFHSGTGSYKMTLNNATTVGSRIVPLLNNQTKYVMSAWILNTGGVSTFSLWVSIPSGTTSSAPQKMDIPIDSANTTTWQKIETTFFISVNGTVNSNIGLSFMTSNLTPAIVYVDDINVQVANEYRNQFIYPDCNKAITYNPLQPVTNTILDLTKGHNGLGCYTLPSGGLAQYAPFAPTYGILEKNTTYKLSGWMLNPDGLTSFRAAYSLKISTNGAAAVWGSQNGPTPAVNIDATDTTNWQKFEFLFTTDKGVGGAALTANDVVVNSSVWLMNPNAIAAGKKIYVDDLALAKVYTSNPNLYTYPSCDVSNTLSGVTDLARVDRTVGRTELGSYKMPNTSTTYDAFAEVRTNLTKNASYKFSAWILNTGGIPSLTIGYRHSLASGGVSSRVVIPINSSNTTQWQKIEGTFTFNKAFGVDFVAGDTITYSDFYLMPGVAGSVGKVFYMDDASLTLVGGPSDYQFGASYQTSGSSFNIKTSVANRSTDAFMGRVISAYYKADNSLANVVFSPVMTFDGYGTQIVINQSLLVPNFQMGEKIKRFIWTGDSISPLTVADVKEYVQETVELTVKPDGTGDFTSPYLANASITDSSYSKRYIINIYPGVYTDQLNWIVKPYVTLKGTDKATCVLKGELPDSATNADITLFSTIYIQETANIENLTITARNMRYPVHSEMGGRNINAVHNITNCRIEHLGNDGAIAYRNAWIAANPTITPIPDDLNPSNVWTSIHAWGYGSGSGVVQTFNNTELVSPRDGFYVHNNKDFTNPQINILNNCYVSSTKGQYPITLQSMGSGTKDKVIFNNCTFTGIYALQDDSPWISVKDERQVANHVEYTLTMNNSTAIGYKDGHRGRALAIFSNSTGATSSVVASGDAATAVLGQYTSKIGGGGLKGYLYGYWDISGILVGLYSNVTVNNTIGRRLGDCSTINKTMTLNFDNGNNVNVVFNQDYTQMTNDAIITIINNQISGKGIASVYNVSEKEYYPNYGDKELVLTNSSSVGIPRFAAVCRDTGSGTVRLMTSTDSNTSFLGISLESIIPGNSGRILTDGIISNTQIYGFAGAISTDKYLQISSTEPGVCVENSSATSGILRGVAAGWARFYGNK